MAEALVSIACLWGVSRTVSCFLITRASSLLHWDVTGVTMWHGRDVTNTVAEHQTILNKKKIPRADTTALEVVYFSHNALIREVKSNRQTDRPRKHVCDMYEDLSSQLNNPGAVARECRAAGTELGTSGFHCNCL